MLYENQTFEEQLRIEHNSRIQRESLERHCKQVRGENIYINFCVWCNCYAENETKTSVPAFKKWLKEQGIELTPYQSRYLLEHKFGYNVWYDNKEKDWRCEKVASAT